MPLNIPSHEVITQVAVPNVGEDSLGRAPLGLVPSCVSATSMRFQVCSECTCLLRGRPGDRANSHVGEMHNQGYRRNELSVF